MPPKHFTITLEYADGYIEICNTDTLMIRGKQHLGKRPYFITIHCNKEEQGYIVTSATQTLIYAVIPNILSGSNTIMGRIMITPIWFHKLVTANN